MKVCRFLGLRTGNSGGTSTRCCSQFGLVQSWLSFRSISRRKARQCSAVGTSDWQQTEQSENVD